MTTNEAVWVKQRQLRWQPGSAASKGEGPPREHGQATLAGVQPAEGQQRWAVYLQANHWVSASCFVVGLPALEVSVAVHLQSA